MVEKTVIRYDAVPPTVPAKTIATPTVSKNVNDDSKSNSGLFHRVLDKKKPKQHVDMVPYFSLFRYADRVDYTLMLFGTLGGIVNGAAMPFFTFIFGDLLNAFGGGNPCADYLESGSSSSTSLSTTSDSSAAVDDSLDKINTYCLYLVYLAIAAFIACYCEIAFWMWTGARQANKVRGRYLAAILRQDVAYFDKETTTGKLLLGLNEDTMAYQNAVSEKVGQFLQNMCAFVVGMIIAFWKGWTMTLVMLALMPVMGITGAVVATMSAKLTKKASEAYAVANGISQQVFSNIRTVAAFNSEAKVTKQYAAALTVPYQVGTKQSFLQGLTIGSAQCVGFLTYCVGMYYGGTQVANGTYNGGQVMQIMFAAVIGSFCLGQAFPIIKYFRDGRAAAASLFETIDKKPSIDLDAPGKELQHEDGALELRHVTFTYPSRPERPVFVDFSLVIPAGHTVALVGESGSGKSTVIQLIQRFYDPESGEVLLDGYDIRTLQLRWLRSRMGFVGQEPMLFATTIRENILYSRPDASEDDIIAATKASNAYEFITRLPEGFNTQVGEKGGQLSGGQKQRIAIARAILRNPKILLLDEATSALDAESEWMVQEALEKLMLDRTTVIVAHRLSTVINADTIAVVHEGHIVEKGNHDELMMQENGYYAALVEAQAAAGESSAAASPNYKSGSMRVAALAEVAARKGESHHSNKSNAASTANTSVHASSVAIEEEVEQGNVTGGSKTKGNDDGKKVGFMRLARYNKPEWPYFLVGLCATAVIGFITPGFSLVFANMLTVFYTAPSPTCDDEIIDGARKYALYFVGISFGALIFCIIQGYCFGLMAQQLARRLRILLFKAVLRQEISWFDKKENSSGAIVGRLATDTITIRGAVGDQVALLLQNLVTVTAAYIIAFTASWSMTLVVTATLPVLTIGAFLQHKAQFGFTTKADEMYIDATQTATEAIGSIRTIAAFSLQDSIAELYQRAMIGPEKAIQKRASTSGAGFGFSQFIQFTVFALAFWFGGTQVKSGNISFNDMLKAFFSVVMAAFGLANAQLTFPDIGKAGPAAKRVFSILDRKPSPDSSDPSGLVLKHVTGHIQLKAVTFAYPSRPEVTIFENFTLEVPPASSLALVGESGSGKSTVVALLERFYDPLEGSVRLDGIDIKKLNLKFLRSQIGLVNQEPVLFSATVLENIHYGRENATLEEVEAACRVANALEFVDKMPLKFDTRLGEQGTLLSGGQKQRIAIARAIIKDPKVLLLDEATSALDAESERLVQLALDKVMIGRTSLIIAHRLSTIRHCNYIAVVSEGKIIEAGEHEGLLQKEGTYAKLVRHQTGAFGMNKISATSLTADMWIDNFESFFQQAEDLYTANPLRTRYLVKYRHCDGVLVLKVTDDNICLKFKTNQQSDLKRVERLNNLFFHYMATGQRPAGDLEMQTEEARQVKGRRKG